MDDPKNMFFAQNVSNVEMYPRKCEYHLCLKAIRTYNNRDIASVRAAMLVNEADEGVCVLCVHLC